MTSRCIISGDQPFFVFAVVSRKVSPKRHRFADLGRLPESMVVKTRRGMQSCRTALGRAMHVARCIRTGGVLFLFRLFTRCRCYTIRWCFSKGQGFLLQISPQDICLLATNFGTGADAVLAIEHVRLLIMIFTSVFVMIYISPTDVSPVLSCICSIAAKVLLNSQQLVVLGQSLRSENTQVLVTLAQRLRLDKSLIILV